MTKGLYHKSEGNCADRKGENHFMSKLTNEQASLIRVLCEEGISKHEIALEFKVSTFTIDSIVSRRGWKHVK